MFCPQCGGEYRAGFLRCNDCDVALVESAPEPAMSVADGEHADLAKVYEASDPSTIALVESVLEDGQIEFSTRGEGIQDLFGAGRIGGFNALTGPVEFYVRGADASEARALLRELTSAFESPSDEPDPEA